MNRSALSVIDRLIVVCRAAACTLFLAMAACPSAPPGGGGGGGGPTNDDCGSAVLNAQNVGCASPSPNSGGADQLPNYALIPAAEVPRVVREGNLPASIDLTDRFPTPCNQGPVNTCVGWVGGYALMTYLAASNIDGWSDVDLPERQFSPTFVFNQANAFRLGKSKFECCLEAGTVIVDMFALLRDTGCTTWADAPYTIDDCTTLPPADQLARAANFRIETFLKVDASDINTLRSYLAQGVPLVAQMGVGQDFYTLEVGQIYATSEAADGLPHAVVVVGYDDARESVRIMNSWGTAWGDGGFASIAYAIWPDILQEAYYAAPRLLTPFSTAAEADDALALSASSKSSITHQDGDEDRPCLVNPLNDADGDGYLDTVERIFADFGFDPLVPNDNPDFMPPADMDGDGWPDGTETVFGTDPNDAEDFPLDCDYQFPEGFFDTSTDTGTDTDDGGDDTASLFAPPTSLRFQGTHPVSLAAADVDGDGDVDLTTVSEDLEQVRQLRLVVFLNDGSGNLVESDNRLLGIEETIGINSLTGLHDLDGDGSLDLVLDDGWFPNDGNGVFGAFQDIGFLVRAVADFDGDGALDLAGTTAFGLGVALNDGAGTFAEPLDSVANVRPVTDDPFVADDLDGDGDPDIVLPIGDSLFVSLNLGAAIFSDLVEYRTEGVSIGAPVAADIVGDASIDLAAAARELVAVIPNAGGGVFGQSMIVGLSGLENTTFNNDSGIVAADLNNDGAVDLARLALTTLAADTPDGFAIFTNLIVLLSDGAGGFSINQMPIPGSESSGFSPSDGHLAAQDLDGDGDVDLIVESITSPADENANVFVLFNTQVP